VIEKSLMVLCFDEPLPESFNLACPTSERPAPSGFRVEQRDETSMAHQLLHGGGSLYNGGNRWYDKTVQVRYLVQQDSLLGFPF